VTAAPVAAVEESAVETIIQTGPEAELSVPARARPSAARGWVTRCIAADATAFAAAALAAGYGASASGHNILPPVWAAAFVVLTAGVLAYRGLYRPQICPSLPDNVRTITGAAALAAMVVLTARVLITHEDAAAAESIRQFVFAAFYLSAGRIALHWSTAKARRAGALTRPTLVVGTGRVARLLVERLSARPEFGLDPVAYLDVSNPDEAPLDLPVAGGFDDVEWVIEEFGIQHVIFTFSLARDADLVDVFERCQKLGVTVSVVPRLYEEVTERVSVEHIGGVPLLTPHRADPRGWHFAIKYGCDRALALVALMLALPILIACALAVWISLGRPIFFRQVRVGRDGRTFGLLKFRSMRPALPPAAAESFLLSAGSAPGGVEGNDRRTRVGTFLRRSSLDELPQLINVLKGEMSLVGPRPERPEFVALFERDVHRYGERCRAKAGITGWAQIHGLRGKTSIADRAEWDNYYIDNFSLWLDVKILLRTVVAVVAGARAVE
jgi:exopolysaccharide biosynthesis polyprenyl glycosylphosphotransferase